MASTEGQLTQLFVYGSLLSGLSAHDLIQACEFKGPVSTMPAYGLFRLGKYPGLGPGTSSIEGECYGVTAQDLERLDHYEGVPHYYTRATIELESGLDCLAYMLTPDLRVGAISLVETCWRRHLRVTGAQ